LLQTFRLVVGYVCLTRELIADFALVAETLILPQPTVEYDFYTFNSKTGNATQYTISAYLYPSFNALPTPQTFGISLDGGAARVVAPIPTIATGQYNPPDWNKVIGDSIRIVQTNFANIAPGKHTLRIDLMSPNLVFEKFVRARWHCTLYSAHSAAGY